MVLDAQKLNVTEFDEWVNLPQNIEDSFEYIRGEIIKVVSNSRSSKIGILIGSYITLHVVKNNLGHTTGADGGYQVQGERYIPDVGFISYKRLPEMEDSAYISIAPDLAVEVVSPTDSQRLLTVKIANYLSAGTVVWVVYPDESAIDVYVPSKAVTRLEKTDTLSGGDVLPNFELLLGEIFT